MSELIFTKKKIILLFTRLPGIVVIKLVLTLSTSAAGLQTTEVQVDIPIADYNYNGYHARQTEVPHQGKEHLCQPLRFTGWTPHNEIRQNLIGSLPPEVMSRPIRTFLKHPKSSPFC